MKTIFDNSPTHNQLEVIYKSGGLTVTYYAGIIEAKIHKHGTTCKLPLGEVLSLVIFKNYNDERRHVFFHWFKDWEIKDFEQTLLKWHGERNADNA